jgi:pyocin large subunit-like protein
MTFIFRLGLFAALWQCQNVHVFAFAPQHATAIRLSTSLLYAANNDAQDLMDKAAKLRAEIAAMEGKTVEQAETEYRAKKELETQRKQKVELERESRKASSSSMSRPSIDEGRYVQVPNTVRSNNVFSHLVSKDND